MVCSFRSKKIFNQKCKRGSEKHHLKRQLLFQKPDKGGLGLSCLQARTLTYIFTRIQGFLNQYSHPSYSLFSHFLYNYQNLHFDFQLFIIKTIPASYVSLPNFYSEVFRAWAASGAQAHDNINHVMNLPINSCILSSLADDDEPDSARLLACGIKQIRHLLHPLSGRWLNASDVVQSICRPRPLSARLLNRQLLRLLSVVVNLFPSVFNLRGLVKSSPVNVNLMPDPPLGIKISTNINRISATSKTIYQHINTNINELPENS